MAQEALVPGPDQTFTSIHTYKFPKSVVRLTLG